MEHLVYEILIDNPSGSRVRLDRLEVRDPNRDRNVDRLGEAKIKAVMFAVDGRGGVVSTRTLKPRQVGVLLMDVRLGTNEPLPSRLTHRFELMVEGRSRTTTTASTPVRSSSAVQVMAPLHGEDLFVLGCCKAPFTHRLAIMQFEERIVAAQRYAIDFVQTDDQLATFSGDPGSNASYYIYGDDVIAVAAGEVIATRNDMEENTPPGAPPGVEFDDLAGNFVTQDLGGGSYALYAHMQPGSVTVQPGDQVQTGQVLGRVGNSGNSSEPHLHFHVMDGPGGSSNLEADGVPYVFERFRFDWVVTGLTHSPPAPEREPAPPPAERTSQMPLIGNIISIAD